MTLDKKVRKNLELEDLEYVLESNRIAVGQYGVNGAKSLKQLQDELETDDCFLKQIQMHGQNCTINANVSLSPLPYSKPEINFEAESKTSEAPSQQNGYALRESDMTKKWAV